MEQRPASSPSHMASSPRPQTQRKRSNSFPIVDALGCSTPEAELLLAEGRAAVRSRHASRRGRGRRNKSENDEAMTYHPQEYIKFLQQYRNVAAEDEESEQTNPTTIRHSRIPSNLTDRSGSTITGPTAPSTSLPSSPRPLASPLGDYSANLAAFIKSQLTSIPSVAEFQAGATQVQSNRQTGSHAMMYPRSCPDLSLQSKTPPQSPTMLERRRANLPSVIEMPSVRPPLKSQFSAWSSTDDSETEDDVPPLPGFDVEQPRKDLHVSNDTPSLLRYYQNTSDSSFLLSTTPPNESEQQVHPNADGFSFPAPPGNESSPSHEEDYPSSALSHPQLSSSSAPSVSSTSTASASYFDYKQPMSLAPHLRDRIIAAVSPHHPLGKTLMATSPWEGGALANVHDVIIESQSRVHVDGMSFDMVRDFNMPLESVSRIPTPC